MLAGLGHYLSLLILAAEPYSTDAAFSRRHPDRSNLDTYMVRQAMMLASLVAGALCGRLYDMAGLANTATVFGVLWLLLKYGEFHQRMRFNGWFLVFAVSLGVYYTALWLHANPFFVVSLAQIAH